MWGFRDHLVSNCHLPSLASRTSWRDWRLELHLSCVFNLNSQWLVSLTALVWTCILISALDSCRELIVSWTREFILRPANRLTEECVSRTVRREMWKSKQGHLRTSTHYTAIFVGRALKATQIPSSRWNMSRHLASFLGLAGRSRMITSTASYGRDCAKSSGTTVNHTKCRDIFHREDGIWVILRALSTKSQ